MIEITPSTMVTNCSCYVVAKFTDPLRDVMDIRRMTSEYFAIWFAGSGSRTSQNWSDQISKCFLWTKLFTRLVPV